MKKLHHEEIEYLIENRNENAFDTSGDVCKLLIRRFTKQLWQSK